ncbi:DNA-3-methyladenine glycosylase [Williamsia phyllosphaerae]|uniref:Putative 3-methyladenine DNA glycosylase n=1 Tax=Williamsia phyllosphaerae TaxID=885042 RepID=A0ABQ1UYM0_9NOCA|nr:DNA-3-methyladenine glycosylase [Williamsia phyllosphaerae]GGF30527.1 putative 3-methyladenine DNA glycosylase [Williamsia phyllosphaerae]
MPSPLLSARELRTDPVGAATRILGSEMVVTGDDGEVRLRIVEVEAYGGPPDGPHPDPAAHSWPGVTPRNTVMFGPPGRLYVYRSYGIHLCVNISCGAAGTASAVLLRAGEVLTGAEVVRRRRQPVADQRRWAMGPGNLGSAVGIALDDNGVDVLTADSPIRLERATHRRPAPISVGPRVGLTVATGRPWRLWIPDSPAVSSFRPGSAAVRRRRAAAAADRLAVSDADAQGSDW